MNKWLEDFSYRITISPLIFFKAGLIAVLIAIVTISWQSIKAAIANPVNSLRNE
jgi:putative ABC transport system permease protein